VERKRLLQSLKAGPRGIPRLSVTCLPCAGTGLTDRPVLEALMHGNWVSHLFAKEICSRCGGSGKVPLDPRAVKET